MANGNWQEVRDGLVKTIENEEQGEELPSTSELAKSYGVGVGSVKRALRDLEAKGYVLVSQGRRPTIVSTKRTDLLGASAHSAELGSPITVINANASVIRRDLDEDAATAAEELELAPDESLLLVDRVRSLQPGDPEKARWDRAYMSAHVMPAHVLGLEYDNPDEPASLMAAQLAAGHERVRREVSFKAEIVDERAREKLELSERAAVLHIRQTSYSGNSGKLVPYEYLIAIVGPAWELRYEAV